MGRINNDRKIHFNYTPDFLYYWSLQTQELKDKCDEIGKPYGYSAMNVFYMWLIYYIYSLYTQYSFAPWIKSNG